MSATDALTVVRQGELLTAYVIHVSVTDLLLQLASKSGLIPTSMSNWSSSRRAVIILMLEMGFTSSGSTNSRTLSDVLRRARSDEQACLSFALSHHVGRRVVFLVS